jgi:beta-phosphoglucomutase
MIKAVIFDMNGVIVNDERIHEEAWKEWCTAHGFTVSEEQFSELVFGRTEKDVFSFLLQREVTPQELEQFSNERVDIAIRIFQPLLAPTPGFLPFVQYLANHTIKLAIATSSRNRYANFILDSLEIRQYFPVIVTAEDITNGKPDPQIYQMAANRLGVLPTECLVFEDTHSGIASAKAADMRVVAIATTHTPEELTDAHIVIPSFEVLDYTQLVAC